mmetsp:Transcript_12645/g.15300  ORF Transcript_12645/g.15300 Transcript_12645/m.15300 type:complete len:152 (+) Transcript_12645:379-834(+)
MAKRLAKEAADLAKQANEGDLDWGSAEPDEENLFKWTACIAGPDNSPYSGGLFNIELNFPNNYPFKPPTVKFLTKVYHPSVKQDTGEICDDIVKSSWAPTLNIRWILAVLRQILENPESDSPLEAEIGELYRRDVEAFKKNAKEFTQKYAT